MASILDTFRDDIFLLLPAVLIASFQLFAIWHRLPRELPKDTEIPGSYDDLERLRIDYFFYFAIFIFLVQLITLVLQITSSFFVDLILKIIGYWFVISGLVISLSALSTLGDNWSGLVNYRIKFNQQLVQEGIYKYIRHPIYLSVLMEILGFELIANSWLFIPFLVIGFLVIYKHSLKEEELMAVKFQNDYSRYQQQTKMFIPHLI